MFFQLHKQQGNPIEKAHNVRTAAVEITMDFQLFDGQKAVVVWALKVDDSSFFYLGSTAGALYCDRNSIANEGIFFLVDLHE